MPKNKMRDKEDMLKGLAGLGDVAFTALEALLDIRDILYKQLVIENQLINKTLKKGE